jgi:hypothetical protein
MAILNIRFLLLFHSAIADSLPSCRRRRRQPQHQQKGNAMPKTKVTPQPPLESYVESEPIRLKQHFLLHCTEVARKVVQYAIDAFDRSLDAQQRATEAEICGQNWGQEIDNLRWLVNNLGFLDSNLLSRGTEKHARLVFKTLAAKCEGEEAISLLFRCITVFRWSAWELATSLRRCQKLNDNEQSVLRDSQAVSWIVFRAARAVMQLETAQNQEGRRVNWEKLYALLQRECLAAKDGIAKQIRAHNRELRQQAKAKKVA